MAQSNAIKKRKAGKREGENINAPLFPGLRFFDFRFSS
jgi:hypothetical protein